MNFLPLTCLISLMIVMLMFVNTNTVGRARQKYEIKAPAISGNEVFERTYRVQMNTIENVFMFFPALWIYAFLIDDKGAFAIGLIWLLGRVWYGIAYTQDPAKRGPGFAIAILMNVGAWSGALYGVIQLLTK